MIKKAVLSILFICVAATGSALTLRGGVGLGAINALNRTLANVLNLQVGTVVMFLNFSFIFVQIALLKKEFKPLHYMQFVLSLVFGEIINFVYYTVLAEIPLPNYLAQMGMFVFGVLVLTFAVSAVLVIDFVAFPIEAACRVVAEKFNKKFFTLRQRLDVLCLAISIGLALLSRTEILVREGTVIQALIFGPLLGFFMPRLKVWFTKYGLAPMAAEVEVAETPAPLQKTPAELNELKMKASS